MQRTGRSPTGAELERTLARSGSGWQEAGLVAALAAAVALWIGVLAGIAAPLGGVLARLDAPPRPAPSCETPPGALASATPPSPRPCP